MIYYITVDIMKVTLVPVVVVFWAIIVINDAVSVTLEPSKWSLAQAAQAAFMLYYRPRDCQDLNIHQSGEHMIYPEGTKVGFKVYCDMDTDGGGWTVFQRRQDNSTSFYSSWNEYQFGFGLLSRNFWLGNEQIHTITAQGWYELRVDLEDFVGQKRFAKYQLFRIDDYLTNYRLVVAGYSGNAGDSLIYHHRSQFSTYDKDNDSWGNNCAVSYKGAWWYRSCHKSNLNGMYHEGSHTSFADGINWESWKGYHHSMKFAEMKIRRK